MPFRAASFLFFSCTTQSNSTIKATISINKDENVEAYNPMIFGGFLEHFGKQIYGGVFDPGSPLSNEKGFRTDVIEALNELKVPIIRWPGGCFVDGYHWINGVGDNRKPTDDIRWGVIEPNTFGTHEFIELCKTWWFESNRMIPIGIFLRQEMAQFKPIMMMMNTKDVSVKIGPVTSLSNLSIKRSKRKSVQLVRKPK